MRKGSLRVLAILLSVILLIPGFTWGTAKAKEVTNEDVDNAKKEKEAIEKRLEEAENNLASIKSSKANVEKYIQQLDGQLEEINGKIYDLSLSMEEKQLQIDETEIELDNAKKDEAAQYESMKLRIQYMYETGQTTYLEAILASDNISELLNNTEYVKSITEYDKSMMDKLVMTKNLIQETDDKLKTEYAELEQLKIDSEAELAAAEYLYSQKQIELAKLVEQEKEAAQLEEKIKSERDAADKNIDNLLAQIQAQEEAKKRAAAQANSTAVAAKGDLIWPLPAYCKKVTELFGARTAPVAGASTYHMAIDLGAASGTPVYAAASGTVLVAEWNYSYGYYVLIYHGNGVATLYAHSSKLLVKAGQEVNQGDTIMLVGSTGYSTGPHLHYEVRINGTRVNPLDYYDTSGLQYYIY